MGRKSQVIAQQVGADARHERAPGCKSGTGSIPVASPASAALLVHRYLPKVICLWPKTAFAICAGITARVADIPRSSTARERSNTFREAWVRFPSGALFFDGPLSLGYLASPSGRAGSNPATSGNRCVPNSLFVRHALSGRMSSVIWFQPHRDGVAGSTPAFRRTLLPDCLWSYANNFRRVAGLGYRLLSAWSRVRLPSPAPYAGVAQW